MKERLAQLLGQPIRDIQKIFGGASYRTYYRIFCEKKLTYILMEMPDGKMSASEEITNLKLSTVSHQLSELPYINIQRYLKSIGMPVPEIKLFSEQDRWLILEDLGDTRLFDKATGGNDKTLLEWYKKAIDVLVALQKKTSPSDCIAFYRSFDATLFDWEFDHFWEYYFGTTDHGLRTTDWELFKKETRKITGELCALPRGFTHRDYQSHNLMVHNNNLFILDFQDALLGPKIYDLVALLRDAYIDLTPHLKTLLEYYCEKSGEDIQTIQRAFDLQTVQRKMKDAGRFVFIDKVKGNPNFLQYIPTSIRYVKQALERLPEYKELEKFL